MSHSGLKLVDLLFNFRTDYKVQICSSAGGFTTFFSLVELYWNWYLQETELKLTESWNYMETVDFGSV